MSELISLIEIYVMPVIRPALSFADTVPGWGACLLMLLFFGLSILFGMIHGAFASREKSGSIELRGFILCLSGALAGWTVYRGLDGGAPDPDPLFLAATLALSALTLLVMLVRRHFAAIVQFLFALLGAVMLGKLCSGIEPAGAAIALFAALTLIGSWLQWAVGKATKEINSGAKKELEKKLDPGSAEENEASVEENAEDVSEPSAAEEIPAEETSAPEEPEEVPQEPVRTIDYKEILGDIITREPAAEEAPQEDTPEEPEEEIQEEIPEDIAEEISEPEIEEPSEPETSQLPAEEPEEEPVQMQFEEPAEEEQPAEEPGQELPSEESPEEQPSEEAKITEETPEESLQEEPQAVGETAEVLTAVPADPEDDIRREAQSLLEDLAREAERELSEDTSESTETPSDVQEIQITAELPEVTAEEPAETPDDGFKIVLSDAEITGELELESDGSGASAETADEAKDTKNTINIAVFGPKGSGKTTLTWALSMINSEFGGREYTPDELDSSAVEREKGTTIEPSFIEYESRLRHIVHIDCPGDPEYYKNEIRGLTEADIGILVIAINGRVTDAREHLYNARMAGIRNLVVFINKCDMDSVTEDDIDSVDSRINRLISKEFDFSDVVTVSGSALAAARDDEDQLFWINSIRELQFTIDTMNPARRRADDGELRMPIGKVYTTPGRGTVVTGRIKSGSVSTGKRVTISGYSDDNRHATVAAIHSFGTEKEKASAGECVGLQLRGITAQRIRRGQVITTANNKKGHRRIGAEFSYVKYSRKEANGRPMSLWDSTKLQFWFGTTDVTGEIRLQEEELHLPGDDFVVIIDLEKPVPINLGDRFLAKQGSQTVAYGEVVRTD